MQNVIHRVMEAENEAKRILQDARTETERLLSEARQQAKANEEKARIEVRQAIDTLNEKAVQTAEMEKTAKLARAALEIESSVQMDDALHRIAVEAVVACVAGNPSST